MSEIAPIPLIHTVAHHHGRLIDRTHLLASLEQGRRGRVMIVQASGGYGKSHLLAAWSRSLRQQAVTVVWPALDDETADARGFIAAVGNAVVKALPGDRIQAAPMTEIDSLRAVTGQLVSTLRAAGRPIVIILDDYDQVSSEQIDAILSELLRMAPSDLHCVLVSRTRLKVPFGMLWFEVNVVQLGQRELRFSDDEIAEMFEHRLSAQDLARISVWTEGWPVAVQLVRHHLDSWCGGAAELDHLLGRAHDDVGRYLTGQVLHNLPEPHRELLILSSALPEFRVELIEAVTGIRPAWMILQELQESNVLIAPCREQDGQEISGWYRCHQLLRAAMFGQLCRRGRRNLASLQLAASRWFAENGYLQEALHYAVTAGDTDFAAGLVLEAGGIFFCIRYGAPALRALMNHLPPDIVADHPRLGLAQVSLLIKEGRVDVGADLLRSLQPRCKAALMMGSGDPLLARDLAMAELTVSAYTGGQSDTEAIDTLEWALLDAPSGSFWLHGILHNILCNARYQASDFPAALAAADTAQYYYALADSSNGAGHVYMHTGMICLEMANPTGALLQFQNSRDAFQSGQCGDDAGCALADVLTAQALYDQARLAEARAICAPALAAIESGENHLEALMSGYQTLTALVAAEEGPQAAARVIARGLAFARRRRFTELEQYLTIRQVELQLETGDIGGLPLHDTASTSWPAQDLQGLVQARLALRRGEISQAVELLGQQQQRVGKAGRLRSQIYALVLLAGAFEAGGNQARAIEQLRTAVLLAMPGELVMPFVEQGCLTMPLLAQVVAAGRLHALDTAQCAFVRRILRLGAGPGQPVASVFSFREREIVGLLVHGTSNKMMARTLEISPETVRFHLKNIYEKLGVSDRRVVAILARERGLVD